MGAEKKLIKMVSGRAKGTALRPFNDMMFKFKKLANVQTFVTKAFKKLSSFLKELLFARPKSFSDYFKVGQLLVFKRIPVILLVILCLAPIAYFELINKQSAPPADVQAAPVFAEYVYSDPAVKEYSGQAKILSEDKELIYTGQIDKGVCNGTGTLYDLKGRLVYEGEFKNNEYSGKGRLYSGTGSLLYEGMFDKNKYNGEGLLYNKNGSVIYSGTFLDNMKHGAGKLYADNSNSLVYEGAFAFDKYNGQGTLYDPATARISYKGDFMDGMRSGQGILYNDTGRALYEGLFLKNNIDYAVFLGALPEELPRHIYSSPTLYTTGVESCLVYSELPVTFGLEASLDDPAAQPVISSVTVFDNMLPYGADGLKSPKAFIEAMGEPVYSGLTFPSLSDMAALIALADNGAIEETDELYYLLPSDMDAFIDDTDSYFPEIYMVSCEYNGLILSAFFRSEDGGFLFYELSAG